MDWVVAAFMMIAAALVGCGERPGGSWAPPGSLSGDISEAVPIPLTGDEYAIVEMATANGAFTVEVEVATDADTGAIARRLVEPVQDRYVEVLVYFYDRASETLLPISRVQWTADKGYRTVEY